MSGPAFGVELPDNLGEEKVETKEVSSPDASPVESLDTKSLDESKKPETIQDILDLDKHDRFRLGGKEWTRNEFKDSQLMREDYTRKTQEVSEARKYADNFAADLQSVIANPSRMSEFKGVYPKAYVQTAEAILKKMGGQTPPQDNVQEPKSQDPLLQKKLEEIDSKLSRVDEWEKERQESETKQIETWLENQYSQFAKKYPYADPEVVTARAQYLSDTGQKIDQTALDKLFKQSDSEIKGKWEKMYKDKVDKQLQAGNKSKDIGQGGGVPGQAPKGFKTIKDATKAFLEDVGAK